MVLEFFCKDKVYEPQQIIGEYTVLKCIGEGKYGICYLVCKDNEKYILKQLKSRILRRIGLKAGYEESLLSFVEHDCIPKFISKINAGKLTGYILEFKNGKTLEEIVFEDKYVFERTEIYRIGEQLINILKYLHHNGIVHRDIRLPNVIYDKDRIYLVDFGLARWTDSKYKCDVDFAYLGDLLIHLFYSSYSIGGNKSRPWYEELDLRVNEAILLKRLLGVEERYKDIYEVEHDFLKLYLD